MDWVSRSVLARGLSNTLDREFYVLTLEAALEALAAPDIFNTDLGDCRKWTHW